MFRDVCLGEDDRTQRARWNDVNSIDSLLRWVCTPIEEGLVGSAALGAEALVGSLPVV